MQIAMTITQAHMHGFIAGVIAILILLVLIYLWQWLIDTSIGEQDEWIHVIRSLDRPSPSEFPPDLPPIHHDPINPMVPTQKPKPTMDDISPPATRSY